MQLLIIIVAADKALFYWRSWLFYTCSDAASPCPLPHNEFSEKQAAILCGRGNEVWGIGITRIPYSQRKFFWTSRYSRGFSEYNKKRLRTKAEPFFNKKDELN